MRRLRSISGGNCALALGLALSAGCADGGPPTAHLRGLVTIGGEPLPAEAEAVITFRPTTIGQADSVSAPLVAGRFDVPDAPQGPVRIEFSIQLPIGEAPFAPGARPEMQYRSLVPEQHAAGMPLNVADDNLNMTLDL